MIDTTMGKPQAYSAEDFESAAQRLLGKRYQILKELNATPAQICSAFNEDFFSGELCDNDENQSDISLMLAVSTEIYLGLGHPSFSGLQPEKIPLLELGLTELVRSDIPPDRGIFVWRNRPNVD
jgi:hypothetical protein